MPNWERALIGAFIAIVVPVSLLVVGWWGAATLSMSRILPLSDGPIAAAAIAGLTVGVLLVIWRLPHWARAFYTAPLALIVPVYLVWTAIATAWFMGLPFGNLCLGCTAGGYAARRALHRGQSSQAAGEAIARTALAAATTTALAALGIGLLAMREPYTLAFARQALGTSRFVADSAADALIVTVAVLGLFVAQYGATRLVGHLALRLPADGDG